jgi:hypothetical protein
MSSATIRKYPVRLALAVVLAAGTLACRPGGAPAVESPPLAPPGSTTAACTAPAAWFPHDQTPQPDDDADFTSNCMFHQWSWQSFLWLTQTMPDGQLRFETFARPAEMLPDEGTPPAYDGRSLATRLVFMPRKTKQDEPTMLDEVNQAGSLGLLVDQDERSVYYSMYVNEVFYDFVRDHGLYDPEKLAATSPTLDFPVGAMELKAAWKIVEDGDGDAGWYTRTATIAELAEENGVVVVSPTETQEVTVALVGLHVAGVVKGHPEFIWATFEHDENAPTLSDAQLAAFLDPNDQKIMGQPVSPQGFTFYAADTTFADSNQNNAGQLDLDAASQTLTPVTNAFIQYAQGGGKADNRGNVQALNASVLAQLDDPVFSHYYLGGAIWLAANDGLVPDSTLQDLITGSTDLSNVTMETFTQKVLEQRNCFGCHNTMQRFPPTTGTGVAPLPGLNVSVSHILVNHYFQASQRELAAGEAQEGE